MSGWAILTMARRIQTRKVDASCAPQTGRTANLTKQRLTKVSQSHTLPLLAAESLAKMRIFGQTANQQVLANVSSCIIRVVESLAPSFYWKDDIFILNQDKSLSASESAKDSLRSHQLTNSLFLLLSEMTNSEIMYEEYGQMVAEHNERRKKAEVQVNNNIRGNYIDRLGLSKASSTAEQ